MKIKLFAISVLMTAFFTAIPGVGSSQDAKGAEKNVTEYKIVRHDTLWGISKRFLKNPFKWPNIWKQNPYIKNPDLIYPGNIVKIFPDGSVEIVKEPVTKELPTVVLEEPQEKVVVLEPPASPVKETKEEPKPKAPALATDAMLRKGFISRTELDNAGVIIGPKEKENQLYATKGDMVLLSLKDKQAAKKGDRYTIFLEEKKIYHPITGAYMGNIVENLGSLTITGTNTPAEALIDTSYKEITMGAKLSPFKEAAREVAITGTESEINGYIIASIEDRQELSEDNIVYIDKGSKDGLNKGNVMRIYRERNKVTDPMNGAALTLPPFDLGTVVIIDAGESTSTGVIVKSLQVINPGDKVGTVPAAKELSAK